MIASAKPLPALKKRRLTTAQSRWPNFKLGHTGEQQAISFLKHHQWQIIDANVVVAGGEIDIIALDPHTHELVFIEVKTRTSNTFGDPSSAVNWRKLRALRAAARGYLALQQCQNDYRFDIICILPDKLEHFENVTWLR